MHNHKMYYVLFSDHGTSREISSKSQHHLRHRSRRMLHTDTTEHAYFCNDPGEGKGKKTCSSHLPLSVKYKVKQIYQVNGL